MKAISKLCLCMFILTGASVTCYGQLFWDFNQSTALPEGWFDRYKVDGEYKWFVGSSKSFDGNALIGERMSGATGSGDGENIEPVGDAQAIFDAYSPSFRFNDLTSSVLSFDSDWKSGGEFDNFIISLVLDESPDYPVFVHIDEIDFVRDQPPIPPRDLSGLANDPDFEPNSSYRIRLRVEDNNNSVNFIDVDNFQLTGAILSADAPLLGDTNNDGIVDIEIDFEAIRTHYLGTGLSRLEGDLTGNGIVDVLDFAEWKDAFLSAGGSASSIPALVGVPEAASGVLALISVAFCTVLRRRRTTSV